MKKKVLMAIAVCTIIAGGIILPNIIAKSAGVPIQRGYKYKIHTGYTDDCKNSGNNCCRLGC